MTMDVKIGDVVRLRKAHPCGSYDWEVIRVGADIGIKCLKCQRKVLLERHDFSGRLKQVVFRDGYQSKRKKKMPRDYDFRSPTISLAKCQQRELMISHCLQA